MTKPKPTVGMTLYSLNVGNAARRGVEQKLTPMEVVKVGRKYFTLRGLGDQSWQEVEFHIEDWSEKTEYCRNHCLYATPQEWEDEKEANAIRSMFREIFSHGYGSSMLLELPHLRLMKAILDKAQLEEARKEDEHQKELAHHWEQKFHEEETYSQKFKLQLSRRPRLTVEQVDKILQETHDTSTPGTWGNKITDRLNSLLFPEPPKEDTTTCEDMLRVVLPMAKGWVKEHDVGSNKAIIEHAEEVLRLAAREVKP